MAARKDAIAEPQPAAAPIDIGLSGADMGIPVLSVVHTSSEHYKNERAKFGDMVIGANSEDTEAEVVYEQGGEPIQVYVVGRVEKWYASKYGTPEGRWDIDGSPRTLFDGTLSEDPMPPSAEMNYRYTFLVPSYSKTLPVHFYVRGTAERAMKGVVNRLTLAAGEGVYPYQFAFSFGTAKKTSGRNTWYVPDPALVEPDADIVAIASRLYAELVPSSARQLNSGNEPGF